MPLHSNAKALPLSLRTPEPPPFLASLSASVLLRHCEERRDEAISLYRHKGKQSCEYGVSIHDDEPKTVTSERKRPVIYIAIARLVEITVTSRAMYRTDSGVLKQPSVDNQATVPSCSSVRAQAMAA